MVPIVAAVAVVVFASFGLPYGVSVGGVSDFERDATVAGGVMIVV